MSAEFVKDDVLGELNARSNSEDTLLQSFTGFQTAGLC
jgi:hypothetical protein